MLILPTNISIGDIIKYANEKAETRDGRKNRYTFAGSEYFNRMKSLNLYTTNIDEIEERISKVGLKNIFNTKLI